MALPFDVIYGETVEGTALRLLALRQLKIADAAKKFAVFAELMLVEAAGHKPNAPPPKFETWQHILCDALQRTVSTDEEGRIVIDAPPQHGKSTIVARLFVAWLLGAMPGVNVILASYGASLAVEHAQAVRRLCKSDLWIEIFGVAATPDPTEHPAGQPAKLKDLHKKRDRQNLFEVGRSRLLAAGMDGAVTGFSANILIVDDPFKNFADSGSKLIRDRRYNGFVSDLSTRVAGVGLRARIVMATRWHPDDLSGRLLSGSDGLKWQHLHFPAIAEHRADTIGLYSKPEPEHPSGWKTCRVQWRQVGDALAPSCQPLEKLETVRKGRPENWLALYQGRPVPRGGASLSWPNSYTGMEIAHLRRDNCAAIIVTVDTNAGGASPSADFCALHGYAASKVNGINLVSYGTFRPAGKAIDDRYRDFVARLKDFVAHLSNAARLIGVPMLIGVEAAAWGKQWFDTLPRTNQRPYSNVPLMADLDIRNFGGRPVYAVPAIGSKTSRSMSLVDAMSASRMHIAPSLAPAVEAIGMMAEQFGTFPQGEHDDDVDAASMACTIADAVFPDTTRRAP